MSLASYYYFLKDVGYGLKYRYMKFGGKINNAFVSFDDGRPTENGTYTNEAQVHFYAFTGNFIFPFGKNDKNEFILQSSLGYTRYIETTGIDTELKATGGSFGYDLNIGYSRRITPNLNLGINVGIFASSISKIKSDDGISTKKIKLKEDKIINLSNFNTGISLAYKL